jgi:hypothetical protein
MISIKTIIRRSKNSFKVNNRRKKMLKLVNKTQSIVKVF